MSPGKNRERSFRKRNTQHTFQRSTRPSHYSESFREQAARRDARRQYRIWKIRDRKTGHRKFRCRSSSRQRFISLLPDLICDPPCKRLRTFSRALRVHRASSRPILSRVLYLVVLAQADADGTSAEMGQTLNVRSGKSHRTITSKTTD